MAALVLEISISAGGVDGYPVSALAPGGAEGSALIKLPAGKVDALLPRIPDAVVASSARTRRDLGPHEGPVRNLGAILFDALFSGEIRDQLAAARQQAALTDGRLRMVLRIDPPELACLPWELLYDAADREYLCLRVPLIRYPRVARPVAPLAVAGPLRVLAMVGPDEDGKLDVAEERDRLAAALAPLGDSGQIELGWVEGQTWRALRAALAAGPWHVLHFIGHGGSGPGGPAGQEGWLVLADDQGRASRQPASNLALLLGDHAALRLVVLNACETGRSGDLDPFSSVAGALAATGVPAALGMQFPITDDAAVEFSRTFYETVAAGLPVDTAVTDARKAILFTSPGTLEWATPVMYLRSADGVIFTPAAQKTRLQTTGQQPAAPSPAELDRRYTDALAAYYTRDWARAAGGFAAVLAADPGHPGAAAKFEEASQQHRLADLYAGAETAAEAGDWPAAVAGLEQLQAIDPGYRDVTACLAAARLSQQVTVLHAEIRLLHESGQWAAVIAAGDRLTAIGPDQPRPVAELIGSAAGNLAAERRAERLDRHYRAALGHMEEARWRAAFRELIAIQRADAGHRDSPALLTRVRAELGKAKDLLTKPILRYVILAESSVWGVAFSPDGSLLATASFDKTARVWAVDLGIERLKVTHEGAVRGLAFSPDGSRLVTASIDKTARVWAVDSGRELLKVTHGDLMLGVAFSPDGLRLATCSNDGTARVWMADTGRGLLKVNHEDLALGVVFSPDGSLLATASEDGTARVWTADSGRELLRITHKGLVKGVAFSPDGARLATASEDGTARVWAADSGRELLKVTHVGKAWSVAFSPDGSLLATASEDGTARIWSADSGRELMKITHGRWVLDVAFSPDGSLLATASIDGTAQVWQLVDPAS